MSVKYVVQSTDKNWRNLAISSFIIGLVSMIITTTAWVFILISQFPIGDNLDSLMLFMIIISLYTFSLAPLFLSSTIFGVIALKRAQELKYKKIGKCGMIFSFIAFLLSFATLLWFMITI